MSRTFTFLEAQSAALGRGSLTHVTQSLTQTPAREGLAPWTHRP